MPDTRARLLGCALRLFSELGFARTSTRALAEAAGANLAAIRYYFGDKAGLYRATFEELCIVDASAATSSAPAAGPQPLADWLAGYFAGFTEPLKQGERMRQVLRLHIREMLEPTEQSRTKRERTAALHAHLVGELCRALGLAQADDDVHRLAIAIGGLGLQLVVAHERLETDLPGLFAAPAALDAWRSRLVEFALALVQAERQRRDGAPPHSS
ncbi:CerR family C-terminal domain-containing protein [Xylophilus rhododendri]|uniref:CerR family C-terminal domain-containing protein n=1 Tax=Xylophilus rhododendri TaxID=2697032 RepID=UPI001E5C9F2C|nr:CerR family C-terminal domain-containing protein [Xylophilus rhododendri]